MDQQDYSARETSSRMSIKQRINALRNRIQALIRNIKKILFVAILLIATAGLFFVLSYRDSLWFILNHREEIEVLKSIDSDIRKPMLEAGQRIEQRIERERQKEIRKEFQRISIMP